MLSEIPMWAVTVEGLNRPWLYTWVKSPKGLEGLKRDNQANCVEMGISL